LEAQVELKLYLRDLGQAYWDFSQNYTSYYMVMFGGAFSQFKPEEESLQAIITALQQVITIITKAVQQGFITEKDPILVVNLVWASLHGTIHLYLGGHIPNEETAKTLYDRSVSNLIHRSLEVIAKSKKLLRKILYQRKYKPPSMDYSIDGGLFLSYGFHKQAPN
jgi:hypothetical protein